MASLLGIVGLLFVVVVHTLLAAVGTRYFRVRMHTRWGAAVYAAVFVPLALLVSTLVLTGVLGLGAPVGGPAAAVSAVVVCPLVFGYAIDVFWMPAPEEVELPDTADGRRRDPPGRR